MGVYLGGRPTAPWALQNPLILSEGVGMQSKGFGFRVWWATNIPVVIEASTSLAAPSWAPIVTNTLTGGSSYFTDPAWTNYRSRFYRIRSR